MIASVATAARYESAACDEWNFSTSEERALASLGLSAQRSAEGLSPRRGGGGMIICTKNTSSASLRYSPLRVLRRTELCAPLTRYGFAFSQPSKVSLCPLILVDNL